MKKIINLRTLAESSEVTFGTSGVRGLVSSMTDEVCYAYIQAFLRAIVPTANQIIVGHDLRPSSPRIAATCIQAIHDSGRQTLFVGELPTPALANYCATNKHPGIIVTGSHIPFERNGIKFYRAGIEIDKADEQAMLEALVDIPKELSPRALPAVDKRAIEAYVNRYISFFGRGTLKTKRIAIYEHTSVARDILRNIFEQLGAEVISLGRTDTFVPIDTEAVRQEDIEQAKQWACEHRFDAILTTDGDADRPLIGDENGIWLRGDQVGTLCARYLGADIVVTPVSSNTAVEKCGDFTQVIRTRIGSPYVIAGMQASQASTGAMIIVGYEANGGFLLGSDISREGKTMTALPTRDAVLPMLALLFMSIEKDCKISELEKDLPNRFTASDRIQQISAMQSRSLIDALENDATLAGPLMAPDAGPVIEKNTTDGLRLTFSRGDIIHLRPSGNAPELRCYTESDTSMKARALCNDCLNRISDFIRLQPTENRNRAHAK